MLIFNSLCPVRPGTNFKTTRFKIHPTTRPAFPLPVTTTVDRSEFRLTSVVVNMLFEHFLCLSEADRGLGVNLRDDGDQEEIK